MDNCVGKILNDKEININEGYMLILFETLKTEENIVTVPLKYLMDKFQTKRKVKISNILRALEEKCYIEIIKTKGRVSSYKIVKDYMINDEIVSNEIIENNDTMNSNSNDCLSCGITTRGEIGNGTRVFGSIGTCNKIDTGNKNVTSSSYVSDTSTGYINDTSTGISRGTGSGDYYDTSILKTPGAILNESVENKGFSRGRYQSDTSCYDINNNNINNNINNKLYIYILNTWNDKGIANIGSLDSKVKGAMDNALKFYSVDEIVGAINNYGLVFESDYFYDYRWSLVNFLNKPNGIGRFLDTGDMWMNYYNNHCSYSEKLKRNGINIEDYID